MALTIKRFRHHVLTPLRDFLSDSRAIGILLLSCTVFSIVLSNLGSDWYRNIWNFHISASANAHLPATPLEWINNFMMSFFFLMAGMEIKRELLNGELSSFKKAVLPFGAAFGGMLVPALIFVAFNVHSSYLHGWGIPTATDIAFSLGVASLLGKRIPVGLKILLMALAIIDDLGAIIVVAMFYGSQVKWIYLLLAGIAYALLLAVNNKKIKFGPIQITLAAALWFFMLSSGIEASISGVLFAFATRVEDLPRIEKAIHKEVSFVILPLFALANTAILIPNNFSEAISSPIGLGVIVGLVVGKPIGIFLVSRLLVWMGVASLPSHVHWKELIGMGMLAGIGFTMSIFTTMLAFKNPAHQDIAKIAVLFSVVSSLVISLVYFRLIGVKVQKAAPSAAEVQPEPLLNLS
jgi:NhaA family Na+:H+ antiporter